MLRTEWREIRYNFNKDVYYSGYSLNRAINGKKSITLDRESSTVKY